MKTWTKILPFFVIEIIYKKHCECIYLPHIDAKAFILWHGVLILDNDFKRGSMSKMKTFFCKLTNRIY